MTPGARAAAAIGVLDATLAGAPAERALTGWTRSARYAGSGDRAAVRDLVFDVLRRRRSAVWLGQGEDGRALVLGLARLRGDDPDALFTGTGHAPASLSAAERRAPPPLSAAPPAVRLDWPDWLWPEAEASLGDDLEPALTALGQRAPVTLRVNLAQVSREDALQELAAAGIAARAAPAAPGAVVLDAPARGLKALPIYREGRVELQDAASQAVVEALPLGPGMAVLDLCAGGGGKTLAMAARMPLRLFCHDAAPRRMADLPARAARAGVAATVLSGPGDPEAQAPFDLVLADAPCTGSGAWARSPDARWRLTPERLAELVETQAAILARAAGLVAPGGALAYATCSFLARENADQVAGFLRQSAGWRIEDQRRFLPGAPGDGFFLAVLRRT